VIEVPEKIIIFDTTLRDGEQCPGASLNLREKLEVAHQLVALNVDVIEGGFPIASPDDFEAVKMMAKEIKGPRIAGLARCLEKDIDRAAQAVEKAGRPRIHVFLATSKIHMQYKLKKAEDEILRMAVEGVKYARKFVDDVEFSPEDASRSDPAFLAKVVEAVIAAGAGTVNIPDTVGYAFPEEFGRLIKYLKENVSNIQKAVISVHCHNDLGLAVANSLAAVRNGARQVECTINGIGEREVNTQQIVKTSRLVSNLTGLVVQPNKAIVGQNAFAHESGIHQDGVLKEKSTYEIITPEEIGLSSNSLVLGKHSGRHAFRDRLGDLGFSLENDEIDKLFEKFKLLADKKKTVYDEDLVALVEDELAQVPELFQLDYLHISTGNTTVPTATVRLKKGEELFEDAACGDGPVEATYNTIDRITGIKGKLLDYALRAVTGGKDAQGEVVVKVQIDSRVITGKGTSTDILEASARAYLNALNRVLYLKDKKDVKGV
jgi:2-isopropylmalate synthase